MKFLCKFILGLTERCFSMMNWELRYNDSIMNWEETSSHWYTEDFCGLTIVFCTRNWYSWRIFFLPHCIYWRKWMEEMFYINYHFRWDLVSFEDLIDTVAKCMSNFRYQRWNNDWLSSCDFVFNKGYSFAIDSHHLFPKSIVAPSF